jgi:hypothetical protein
MRASAHEGRRLAEDWAPAAERRPPRLAPTAASLRLGGAPRGDGGRQRRQGGQHGQQSVGPRVAASTALTPSHFGVALSVCTRAVRPSLASIRINIVYFRVTKQYSVMCYCYACSLWWAAVRWCIRRTTLTSTKGRPRRLSPDRRPSRPFRSMTG